MEDGRRKGRRKSERDVLPVLLVNLSVNLLEQDSLKISMSKLTTRRRNTVF